MGWLDHKPYDELPYYLSWFDKCFLPFKDCELIKYVNPCKLWEYMASEKEIIKYNVNMDVDEIISYKQITEVLNLIIKSKKFKSSIINDNATTYDLLKQRPQNIMSNICDDNTLSIYVDRNEEITNKYDKYNFKIISNSVFMYIIKNNIKLHTNFIYFFSNTEKYIYANRKIFNYVIFDLMDNPVGEFEFWQKKFTK